MSLCDICGNWARTDIKIGAITNHAPNCPHYNDSLIDVWRVSDGTCHYVTRSFEDAEREAGDIREEGGEELTVTREKMHREVFEQLPEFNGF